MKIKEYFSVKELIFFLRGRKFTEKEAKEIREILDIGTKHLKSKSSCGVVFLDDWPPKGHYIKGSTLQKNSYNGPLSYYSG